MRKLWDFLARPQNLALLLALGAGTAWLWTEIVKPSLIEHAPPPSARPEAPAPSTGNAIAAEGGAAVISTGSGQVTIHQQKTDQ